MNAKYVTPLLISVAGIIVASIVVARVPALQRLTEPR